MSRCVVFPEPGVVELADEPVPAPGRRRGALPGRRLADLDRHRGACLRGVFEPGTNWADWVRYPFRPGYSMAATRDGRRTPASPASLPGDRVASWAPHAEEFVWPARTSTRIPAGVTSQDASWSVLGSTTQLAVRRRRRRWASGSA